MWPLDSIRSRRRQKRYDCALSLFAADFTFSQLGSSDRAKVESKVSQVLNGAGVMPAEFRRWAPGSSRMAFLAEAMSRLGMPPAAKGVEWPNFVGKASPVRAGQWFLDYRETDEATVAAQETLRRVGAYLPRNPLDETFFEPNLIPGPRMTVREYFLRKRAQASPNKSLERTRDR
jgi:hypothetical protein